MERATSDYERNRMTAFISHPVSVCVCMRVNRARTRCWFGTREVGSKPRYLATPSLSRIMTPKLKMNKRARTRLDYNLAGCVICPVEIIC